MDRRFMEIYRLLRRAYGPRRWWPVTPAGAVSPAYTGGPRTAAQRFEVAAGAILTQNTAWANAARAIESLNRLGALSPGGIARLDERSLAAAVRSAGYYHQKAKRLRIMAGFFLEADAEGSRPARAARVPGPPGPGRITRASLLALEGVGPETADSIMLYAFGEPVFVIDAYTRRLFGRLGLVDPGAPYEELRAVFERNVPRRASVYREYHALIVEHGRVLCRKCPICNNCLLKGFCMIYDKNIEGKANRAEERD